MDNDDSDLFQQAMGDVQRIDPKKKVALNRSGLDKETAERRRQAAQEQTQKGDNDDLHGDYQNPVDPHDVLSFKQPGVQHGVFKNLRLGKYSIDARLDLHRLSVEEARSSVKRFVKDCTANDVRCALITHGKGENRQPRPALLKTCVAHWLPQIDNVLAFHSAQKQHGGVGATYILLKKSEKKRQDNLERHQRRPS